MATIQGIYIALFGRPADPLGLAFFEAETQGGADLTAIGDLAATAEYQARFEGMSSAQIVTAIYQSLFGRNPELAGLEFFVAELESGRQNINTIAINILDGAQGNDALVVANKIAAADLWTAAIAADPDALAAYQGQVGIDAGVAFLAGITADPATVPTEAQVDAAVAALIEGVVSPIGETFTLTPALGEQVIGTDANDTFIAVAGGDDATLNVGDQIDGKGGTDTLNLFIDGEDVVLPVGSSIKNVEIVNLISTDDDHTMEDGFSAAAFVGATQVWQVNEATNVTGVGTGTTAGFRTIEDLDVAVTFTGATGNVALDVSGDTDLELLGSGTGANVLRTVNISGDADDSLTLDGAAGIRTVNLALSSDSTVDVDALVGLRTFDASGSTGDLEVTFDLTSGSVDPDDDVLVDLETIVLGSGDDTVTLANWGGQELTIDLGAGDDELTIDGTEAGLTVSLGAGFDVFNVGGLANLTTADEDDFADDIIQITDFNGAQDYLALGIDVDTLTNSEANALATALGEDGLFGGLEYLAGVAGKDTFVFEFEGSTYIYVSTDAEIDAGDGLLQLTGYTGGFTAANADFA